MATKHYLDQSDKRLLDKKWRLSHLYKIVNRDAVLTVFKPNRVQRTFEEQRTNRNIILKSRRLGFTTYEAIDSLDDAMFMKNFEAMMLSYDQTSQLDIFDNKIDFAWKNIHPDIQALYELDADRANKLKFNWGDESFSSIAARTHGRSGTYNRVHVSEFAKICKESRAAAKEIISGTFQAVPIDGRIDIESTSEGEGGYFYEMFMEAWERGGPKTPVDFKAHFFNWTFDDDELEKIVPMDPAEMPMEFQEYKIEHSLSDREITYYYFKWLELHKDWELLNREFPTTVEEAFKTHESKFFDAAALEKMVIREPEQGGHWLYFLPYRPNHRYGAGADVSEGLGMDNAVIAIWDFDARDGGGNLKPEVAAIYVNDKIAPDLFAYEIRNGCRAYGNCLVAVERNNHGHATIAILKTVYNNLYKERTTGKMGDEETEKLGWHSNLATKPKMLYDMKTAIAEQLINIPCKKTVSEFKTYESSDVSKVKSSAKDDEGSHWDRVTAVCIGYQMRNYAAGSRYVPDPEDKNFDPFGVTNSIF